MASTYAQKIISANDIDNGDLLVHMPPDIMKDRDEGEDIDLPENMNGRVDNPTYYTA